MKYFGFIILLTFSNFLVQSANATNYEALVIQNHENELKIVKAATDVAGLFFQYVSKYEVKTIYYMCPNGTKYTLKIKIIVNNRFGGAELICNEAVQPTISKVIGEFKNDEGKEDVHIYDIGFTVHDSTFKSLTSTRQYESIDKDDYFIPMISVYRDKRLLHTIAVRYEILTTDIRKKLDDNLAETYQMLPLFDTKVEHLVLDQKSKLTEILGTNYIESNHFLVFDSLVNENDFLVETWKKTTRYKIHQIPIWKENFQMWRDIREFIRHIASAGNARITVYAGIGKALTVTGNDRHKYKLEWNQGEDTIFIPELYWTAVDFTNTTGNDQETTGMVVIMHNEPSKAIESNVEKICDTDFCRTNEIWSLVQGAEKTEGRVYCCPINPETTKKLGVDFLLKNRPFFRGWKGIIFPPKWK